MDNRNKASDVASNAPTSTLGSFRHQIIVGNIDISDLVTGGVIKRSLAEPVGTWTLHLRPIVENGIMKSVPINMNDYTEIRLERTNQNTETAKVGSNIRVVMRGFVDNEDMTEQASKSMDGSVDRQYILSGSDVGKMMARRLIFIPPSIDYADIKLETAKTWLQSLSWNLEASSGDPVANTWRPLSKWAGFFLSSVYKTELERMINGSRGLSKDSSGAYGVGSGTPSYTFKFNFDLPKLYRTEGDEEVAEKIWVSTQPILNSMQTGQTISFWDLIQLYCTKPFIEIFFTENNDETVFNMRWSPLRMRQKVSDTSLNEFEYFYPRQWSNDSMPWFSENVTMRQITSKQILTKQVRRQELDRCTWFYVRGKSPMPDTTVGQGSVNGIKGARGSNPYIDTAALDQFGIRAMNLEVPWWPVMVKSMKIPKDNTDTDPATSGLKNVTLTADIDKSFRDFNTWLVDTMTFNDALYAGQIIIVGNTDIQVGEEISIIDTDELYYVESIEHTWQVFPSPYFYTRLGVSRGVKPLNMISDETNFALSGLTIEQTDENGNTVSVIQRDVTSFRGTFAG